ncbi:YopX family protein [Alicyclobacillus tolerans]|uniref:YopX family protein n=1 Tax=Alicyclobacillus tolerans TaxID=90970 RepID=UPI001F31FA7F|nr:YopX family protein [Alicyclobacillus tolerans]MCF8566886.1 YopX family protein [Alicyclobacillus tolerans]
MREIKFRGKRIDYERWPKNPELHWVYGHYFVAPLTDENSGMPAKSGWSFLGGAEQMHCIEQDGVSFVVDPKTLGQYAGLSDKNGVEIYEDDALGLYGEFDEGRLMYAKSRVIFVDGCFTIGDDTNYTDLIPISQWLEDGGSAVEVLGNVHENPELLQQDEEGDYDG